MWLEEWVEEEVSPVLQTLGTYGQNVQGCHYYLGQTSIIFNVFIF